MTDRRSLPPEGQDRPDADRFGRALPAGIGINLLVRDIESSARFQVEVLGAVATYWDRDFAVMSAFDSVWMLHHDRTYRDHPLRGIAQGAEGRGAGAELRLYGVDPDRAVVAARARGDVVLADAMDKPHGLREAYLIDPDGYIWVPSVEKQGD